MAELTYRDSDGSIWRDGQQRTKLMLAIEDGLPSKSLSIIDEAKKNGDLGALLSAWDINGSNALMYAVVHTQRPVAARIYAEGSDPDGTNFIGNSARRLAEKNYSRASTTEAKDAYAAILDELATPRPTARPRPYPGRGNAVDGAHPV